jgi:hypothetical protein
MDKTYWNSKGKYQHLADKLYKFIPREGSVPNAKNNPALEKFRIASTCYYDLFNNGLCNRAKEFRKVFGFGGMKIVKNGFPYHAPLELKMDEIIVNAVKEQALRLMNINVKGK